MSKKANSEQLMAIEHEGGVLLKAGAGSGKTFVLVEHIVYLTGKWISEYKQRPQGNLEEFLRSRFSQIVMMTFTKKAAGEMSIRLAEKFQQIISLEVDGNKYWHAANECLPNLMVTTIDGFCRKLITAGFFPHLSTEAKVVFNTERTEQVSELVGRWFEENLTHIDPEVLEIMIREKNSILRCFTVIFNDPGPRLLWKKFVIDDISLESIDQILKKSFELNELSYALDSVRSLDLPVEAERSSFEKIVAQFQGTGLPLVESVDKLIIYKNIFSEIKVLRGESGKKKTYYHEAAKSGLQDLREWINKWFEVITDYKSDYYEKIIPWMKLCLELFHWIENRLDPNYGMTFGDIEYQVALGLENSETMSRINKAYSYFIVDEFQDTSALQFKIIGQLINQNFKKLFCVGDAKQAIYGFRGGELSVFRDCSELVPQVRQLANNYRSLPEIIRFNNSLFKTILPLGRGFVGHDPFSVTPEDQNVPDDILRDTEGRVTIFATTLERNLEAEGKFRNDDINRLEAKVIADSIFLSRKRNPADQCTVLYSKLRPSGELIRNLMKLKVGFTAQFKIDLLDDPLLGIFLVLLKRQFDSSTDTKDKYPLLVINKYLEILGVERIVQVAELIKFEHDIDYWGPVIAFRKFIHSLSITNENADINLNVIETISNLYHQNQEEIMVNILGGENDRLSLELRVGIDPHMVQIMSAHASKGLEFDIVYLGGIYTNGKDVFDGPLLGNMPGSFKWYRNLGQREKQKSPLYVFENELDSYKNFSESKRLLYVACTRARKQLAWVDFVLPEKSYSIPKNSWIDGLRVWASAHLNTLSNVAVEEINGFDSTEILLNSSLPELPMFFYDSMGVHSKSGHVNNLAVIGELSVTRLNSLIDCQRKFYFSNVLKLNETIQNQSSYLEVYDESEEVAEIVKSSSDRGTLVHEKIAEGIERNFIVPRDVFESELALPVQWALELLKKFRNEFDFISEKQIKFEFFDYMISGIPDLVLIPKTNESIQIWDFKTGHSTQDNLTHYWTQLSIYAYAFYILGKVDKKSEIILVLCFVDQKKILTEAITWERCRKSLYSLWKSQNEPWKINPEHCSRCQYGDICPR